MYLLPLKTADSNDSRKLPTHMMLLKIIDEFGKFLFRASNCFVQMGSPSQKKKAGIVFSAIKF